MTPPGVVVVLALLLQPNQNPTLAVSARGIVESPDWDGCQTGCEFPSLQAYDPCLGYGRGNPDDLFPSPPGEMDAFLCRHVDLEGPSVCGTCCFTDPSTVVETLPQCTNEIRSFRFDGANDTLFSWERRPCAVGYDVVRGSIPPEPGAGTLGTVTCLSNDQPQTPGCVHSLELSDSEIPAEGHAFFYLVRANGAPYGGDSYGRGSDGTERLPTRGDCPP